jgi:hypothetical protein
MPCSEKEAPLLSEGLRPSPSRSGQEAWPNTRECEIGQSVIIFSVIGRLTFFPKGR